MLNGKTIAVVIPSYNEARQIAGVISTMPDFVDKMIVVDDFSNDGMHQVVRDLIPVVGKAMCIPETVCDDSAVGYKRARYLLYQRNIEERKFFNPQEILNTDVDNDRLILIRHTRNGGVGAAIASGYKWCKDRNIDCVAVMAGDGQMDPDELESICKPVVEEGIDYVKGNRLIHRAAYMAIPRIRFMGNSMLSVMTKVASGYWHVSDTQTGYTAISAKALAAIPLYKIYKRYGMPNDMLVKLNISFCTLREVEIKPVYFVGERSKMKVFRVIPKISWLLFRSFFRRLYSKYLFRDFHPLFILYHVGFILGICAIPYGIKILKLVIQNTSVNPLTLLAFMFLAISSLQAILFAMWMDIQDNERLYK
jgi:glycosyltransferase involved in cell wall biosynthesis